MFLFNILVKMSVCVSGGCQDRYLLSSSMPTFPAKIEDGAPEENLITSISNI